jgi:hypothetical protein
MVRGDDRSDASSTARCAYLRVMNFSQSLRVQASCVETQRANEKGPTGLMRLRLLVEVPSMRLGRRKGACSMHHETRLFLSILGKFVATSKLG